MFCKGNWYSISKKRKPGNLISCVSSNMLIVSYPVFEFWDACFTTLGENGNWERRIEICLSVSPASLDSGIKWNLQSILHIITDFCRHFFWSFLVQHTRDKRSKDQNGNEKSEKSGNTVCQHF
jgi:hypothetical protein